MVMTLIIICLLIIAGFVFITIELFLIPGFSIPGLAGLGMVGYGIFKTHQAYGPKGALIATAISALAAFIVIITAIKSKSARTVGLDYSEKFLTCSDMAVFMGSACSIMDIGDSCQSKNQSFQSCRYAVKACAATADCKPAYCGNKGWIDFEYGCTRSTFPGGR